MGIAGTAAFMPVPAGVPQRGMRLKMQLATPPPPQPAVVMPDAQQLVGRSSSMAGDVMNRCHCISLALFASIQMHWKIVAVSFLRGKEAVH